MLMLQCKFCDEHVSESEYARHVRTHKKEEEAICLACGIILGKDSFYSHAMYLCRVNGRRVSDLELVRLREELHRRMSNRRNKRRAKVFQGGLPTLGKSR
jgi:aerobic-type carbon monoxide dehydrogenase small subunit (CoxS/CutS family)